MALVAKRAYLALVANEFIWHSLQTSASGRAPARYKRVYLALVTNERQRRYKLALADENQLWLLALVANERQRRYKLALVDETSFGFWHSLQTSASGSNS